jgi:hypothetical protein
VPKTSPSSLKVSSQSAAAAGIVRTSIANFECMGNCPATDPQYRSGLRGSQSSSATQVAASKSHTHPPQGSLLPAVCVARSTTVEKLIATLTTLAWTSYAAASLYELELI